MGYGAAHGGEASALSQDPPSQSWQGSREGEGRSIPNDGRTDVIDRLSIQEEGLNSMFHVFRGQAEFLTEKGFDAAACLEFYPKTLMEERKETGDQVLFQVQTKFFGGSVWRQCLFLPRKWGDLLQISPWV